MGHRSLEAVCIGIKGNIRDSLSLESLVDGGGNRGEEEIGQRTDVRLTMM